MGSLAPDVTSAVKATGVPPPNNAYVSSVHTVCLHTEYLHSWRLYSVPSSVYSVPSSGVHNFL